jgi:EpsI family protein
VPKTKIGVPVFLGVQIALAYLAAGPRILPADPDLGAFPKTLGAWTFLGDDKLDPATAQQLGADVVLNRYYSLAGTNLAANVFVGWYRSQTEGIRQPHSPQVCLPANGWTTDRSDQVRIATDAGTIDVNRLAISNASVGNQGQRGAMLYWYQTPNRVVSGDWAAKFWFVEEAVQSRRTDAAFVRVFIPYSSQESAATEAAQSLTRLVYPVLRSALPK